MKGSKFSAQRDKSLFDLRFCVLKEINLFSTFAFAWQKLGAQRDKSLFDLRFCVAKARRMKITERQGEILNRIVGEYINSAEPVSSKLLEKKYDFNICPATIRIEMQKLTDDGFISQPHTSAGRVPTDKGYRFFVDDLLESGFLNEDPDFRLPAMGDSIKFIQLLTKNLAEISSGLVLTYLSDEKILWKEGWGEILREPEFKETKIISNFTELIENFEKEIEDIEININSGIKVYIGKENPFHKAREFSIIITKCHFPGKEEGFLAIMGPKRMAYDKNIGLINSLAEALARRELEEF